MKFKRKLHVGRGLLLAATAALVLSACGGGGGSSTADSQATGSDLLMGVRVTQTVDPAGRLLASNCFQCHGTNGTGGFKNISGQTATSIKQYLNKPARSDIMAAHAQGYTNAQLDLIIAYLQQR